MKPSLCSLQALQQLLQALCVILACTGICRGYCRCSTGGNRSCRKMVLCSSCGKNSRKVKSITYASSIRYVSITTSPLLYNYCAMFVLADRGMHILHMNVLKNDSIVGYVVFDFDLLLSDDNRFQYSTNHHSNTTRQRLSTSNNTNQQQLSLFKVIYNILIVLCINLCLSTNSIQILSECLILAQKQRQNINNNTITTR